MSTAVRKKWITKNLVWKGRSLILSWNVCMKAWFHAPSSKKCPRCPQQTSAQFCAFVVFRYSNTSSNRTVDFQKFYLSWKLQSPLMALTCVCSSLYFCSLVTMKSLRYHIMLMRARATEVIDEAGLAIREGREPYGRGLQVFFSGLILPYN